MAGELTFRNTTDTVKQIYLDGVQVGSLLRSDFMEGHQWKLMLRGKWIDIGSVARMKLIAYRILIQGKPK